MTTFVLVHGAWHGDWCWDRVRGFLEPRGHEVVTPQLPSDVAGAGRADYLDTLEKALVPHADVVLVAHSMSGLLAPLLTGHDAVASLVLLAAMVPRPGAAWLDNGPAPYTETMQRRSARMTFDDAGRSSWGPSDAAELFYQDCPPADAAQAVSQLRPDSTVIYGQKCPDLPERRVPVTYVSCRQDRIFTEGWNARAATELLGADQREINTGHSPFWSAPRDVADLLEDLA
jgi:alpha-beta hydrolase superfamily lysophospholipase